MTKSMQLLRFDEEMNETFFYVLLVFFLQILVMKIWHKLVKTDLKNLAGSKLL